MLNRLRPVFSAALFAGISVPLFAGSRPAPPAAGGDTATGAGSAMTAPGAPGSAGPSAEAPAKPQKLTIEACIEMALQKNFTVQIQRYNVATAQDALQIAKATFDPTISLSSTRTFSQSSNTTTRLNGAPAPVSDNMSTRLGVSQEISTGATVGLSTGLNRSSNNSSFSVLNPAYMGNVTLTVTQPLLKGAGSSVTRANIERSRIGVNVANLNFQGQVMSVVQNTEDAYYNLVYAREQLQVYRLSLDLAQKLLEEAQEKRRVGTATDIDVLQAQVGVANARSNVLQGQQALKDNADSLLALIGQFDFNRNVTTVGFPEFAGPIPVISSAYEAALAHQPDFLAAKAAIEQTRIDVRVARNQKRPDLSVGGALGYNGTDTSAANVYQDIPAGDSYNWQLNLTMSFPWGFRGDTARYHEAVSTLHQEQTSLRQLQQNILVQVRSAVRAVQTNSENVKIAALSAEYSSKQYDLQRARFDAGLATSRDVLQTQSDLENARLAELKARVTLQTSLAGLRRIEGESLRRYHIVVPQ